MLLGTLSKVLIEALINGENQNLLVPKRWRRPSSARSSTSRALGEEPKAETLWLSKADRPTAKRGRFLDVFALAQALLRGRPSRALDPRRRTRLLIDCACGIRITYRWEILVNTVKVSPKYQIVIPKEVREALDLRPGQEVAVLRYRGRIELIPMKPVTEMRGFLRGVDSTIGREPDREL